MRAGDGTSGVYEMCPAAAGVASGTAASRPPVITVSRVAIAVALTALCYLALNLQVVTITGQVREAADGPAPKLYHGVLALAGAALLARHRVVRWRPEMLAYFGVTLLTSLLAYSVFEPRPVIANTVFACYTATVGATLGAGAGGERALRALRLTSGAVLLAVLAKAALHLSAFVAFFAAPNGHPAVPVFFGGGPNLEATWVALAASFFVGSALFVPYLLGALVVSALYASRVGIVIGALVLAAAVFRRVWSTSTPGAAARRRLAWALAALAAAGVGAGVRAALRDSGEASYVAQRFRSIGDEPGSLGRLTLWAGGVRVFARHPLGVGEGNALPHVERILGEDLPEDNLHNQYLQHLVETGIQGLVVYLLFAAVTWRRLVAARFRDPMLVHAGIYLVVAAIQFRGAEAIFWFVYGLQHGSALRVASPAEVADAA